MPHARPAPPRWACGGAVPPAEIGALGAGVGVGSRSARGTAQFCGREQLQSALRAIALGEEGKVGGALCNDSALVVEDLYQEMVRISIGPCALCLDGHFHAIIAVGDVGNILGTRIGTQGRAVHVKTQGGV